MIKSPTLILIMILAIGSAFGQEKKDLVVGVAGGSWRARII